MKTFEGNEIEVKVETESTLFVANFPPTADETFIRDLLSPVSPSSTFQEPIVLMAVIVW